MEEEDASASSAAAGGGRRQRGAGAAPVADDGGGEGGDPPPPPPPEAKVFIHPTDNHDQNNNNNTSMSPAAASGANGAGNSNGGPQQHVPLPQQGQGEGQGQGNQPPQAVLQLWSDVADNLSKHQTVVWTKAVDSLESSRQHLSSTPDARKFIDKYMMQIISILLEQQPMKIGQMEKDCVEKSVRCSLQIVKEDLEMRVKQDKIARERDPNVELEAIPTLDALGHVFNKKKVYYKSQRQWSNTPMGLPEVRSHMISVFRRIRGFQALVKYLDARAGTKSFPSMDLCKDLLGAVFESVPSGSSSSSSSNNNDRNQNGSSQGRGDGESEIDASQSSKYVAIQNEARSLAEAIMKHILLLDEITLKKMDADTIRQIRVQLHRLYTRLADSDTAGAGGGHRALAAFFSFWRSLALKLITSASLPLKLSGWDNIVDIISESEKMAPPPKSYRISRAGTPFINGLYEFDRKRTTDNGYARPNCELQYHCRIPQNEVDPSTGKLVEGAGKTLTLFRCTMRSQHKWWFLSEADIDQPGTDKDIDYYQHKSKKEEEAFPSPSGWLTCRAGADPPPKLAAVGKLVPEGEEQNTLEHQLARWAIENKVIELVLGDGIHREVVSRSVGLINFLAGMCDRDIDDVDGEADLSSPSKMDEEDEKNKYCLKASHLLLAWKTCTNKADAAVSAQIYQLLVSILPSLSPSLAIPLIEAIRDSLESTAQLQHSKHPIGTSGHPGIPSSSSGNLAGDASKRGDHFFEVSEFCCAIAEKMLNENTTSSANSSNSGNNANQNAKESKGQTLVRESILSLQWAVLSHPNAQALKSYESIKRYVATEIRRQDATTGRLRMKFFAHCREEIAKNAAIDGSGGSSNNLSVMGQVDEIHALHVVQLSKFVLEGYSREEMEGLVAHDPRMQEGKHFPTLLFGGLISYLKRRRRASTAPMMRKPSSTSIAPEFNHARALGTRLQILRFVYGLTPISNPNTITPTTPQSKLSTTQLTTLWSLCTSSVDREALMMFLSNASKKVDGDGNVSGASTPPLRNDNSLLHNQLEPAFVDNVYVFEKLFCCEGSVDGSFSSAGGSVSGVGWEQLGETAYTSFQSFDAKEARDSERTTDALWNICLSAGNDGVAGRAMHDLLAVYSSSRSSVVLGPSAAQVVAGVAPPKVDQQQGGSGGMENQFSQRIFTCLTQVKEGLQRGDRTSERSAERCIRILSAAIEQCHSLGGSASAVVERLMRLQALVAQQEELQPFGVEEYLNLVPHGMRGVCSCGTVSVIARITGRGSSNSGSPTNRGNENEASTRTSTGPERFSLGIHPLQTLESIKEQIGKQCGDHNPRMIKLTNLSGRTNTHRGNSTSFGGASASSSFDSLPGGRANLSTLPDSALAADVGIGEGSELIAFLSDKPMQNAVNNNGNNNSGNGGKYQSTAMDLGPQQPGSVGPKQQEGSDGSLDLSGLFSKEGGVDGSSDLFFDTLISVLESLPASGDKGKGNDKKTGGDTHSLVWNLLLAMPTNAGIIASVQAATSKGSTSSSSVATSMEVEPISGGISSDWSSLLDFTHFERSVYVMQILDSSLRPSTATFAALSHNVSHSLSQNMEQMAAEFRTSFIQSGGLEAVLRLFIQSGKSDKKRRRNRMGNECALRIIKDCFFAKNASGELLSLEGRQMIDTFPDTDDFLQSLVYITIQEDCGVSDNAILRVLKLARMMLESGRPSIAATFTSLPNNATETFLTSLLLWKGSTSSSCSSPTSSSALISTKVRSATNIRKSTERMILAIPLLSEGAALPWLVKSLEKIDPYTDGSDEFFSVLLKLVNGCSDNEKTSSDRTSALCALGTSVCVKLARYPNNSPGDDGDVSTSFIDQYSTGVLCGCLKLLISLIEVDNKRDNGGGFLVEGSRHILQSLQITPWSDNFIGINSVRGLTPKGKSLIDLMGSIFDGFISASPTAGSSSLTSLTRQPSGAAASSTTPACCDATSRRLAFNVIRAAAQSCSGGNGYAILSDKINGIIANVAPALRHRWGQNASVDDSNSSTSHRGCGSSTLATPPNSLGKYSGLKNQGCTCYMNSVLQQLFMMPALRTNLISAQIPTSARSSGGGAISKGNALVNKKISLHWENGNKYDAMVVGYDDETGMHTIEYCMVHLSQGVGHHGGHHGQHQQSQPPDVSSLPLDLPEELILSEGRPGKETGAFEIVNSNNVREGASSESKTEQQSSEIEETPDESTSRILLEEVQRTFVNLDESCGSYGTRRCFDPRSLVEASHCLKLEFDVWQQNDASEFAMKLLDRLEISLKKWSPRHFRYLGHTFGMRTVKQKICRECGLKTNREENLMNIDCQIRNKSSIHEGLSSMCEDEIMEGDNKVLCDRCKVKTNTVMRTAISALPDMLVLSLKRFDLDYTTFETVKLNSRCEFGESLNMKRYTIEAKEILEAAGGGGSQDESKSENGSMMDVEENAGVEDAADEEDPLSTLPDEDYEYKLAGVLVHAGVAQGGHYYSFIKDRTTGTESAKWYRFDDEDVTPFDPSSIEHECFGGKVKKETKFPNGHTHTVESEQFANALMLFYEKVKPVEFDEDVNANKKDKDVSAVDDTTEAAAMEEEPINAIPTNLELSNGYDIFLPEVRKSNSTHSWQSFLLTEEFQTFVKEILDLCTGQKKQQPRDKSGEDNMDITPASSPSPDMPGTGDNNVTIEPYQLEIIQMALSFVFDILFHLALKKSTLDSWSSTLMQIFSSSHDVTAMFVADLAKRTHKIHENWIRKYVMECLEEGSRRCALRIFARAIYALLGGRSSPTSVNENGGSGNESQQAAVECALLSKWTKACYSQVSEHQRTIKKRQHVGVMPTLLLADALRPLEDVNNLGTTATGVGIILSHLAELIEVSPRYNQANMELCYFIRELACSGGSRKGAKNKAEALVQTPEEMLLRAAMVEAQFIARLTCLAIREKSHDVLKHVFPGSSVSLEVIEAISRNETQSHSANILGVGMNNSGSMNGGGGSNNVAHTSNLMLLEAVGCLLGLPWLKQEPLYYETGEINRGRAIRALTPKAIEALTAVFQESKPSASQGMTMRDIHHYLQKCGQHVPPQRIEQIFARHAVVMDEGDEAGTGAGDGRNDNRLLNLKGFLAYYRDAVHNEHQVQSELHIFGFRPNLTRRHPDSRWYMTESNEKHAYSLRESIAIDVFTNCAKISRINYFTEVGIQALYFLNLASQAGGRSVSEYLLASTACNRDTRQLMSNGLDYMHGHVGNWVAGSNDGYPLIMMIFSMLAAIPDSHQQERIHTLMINEDRHEEQQAGLMVSGDRILREYPNNYQARAHADRYLECIQMIQKQTATDGWMRTNRQYCTWMEPERTENANPLQQRSDHSGRRGGGQNNAPAQYQQNHHHDPNAVGDESDIDDEDSRSDDDDDDDDYQNVHSHHHREMVVEGCGVPEINGVYRRAGDYDGVPKYTKSSRYHGKDEEFTLFRCKLTDNTRRWYISIVPMTSHPGTTKDIDFYAAVPAPGSNHRSVQNDLPPRYSWMCIPNSGGIMPAPEVYPHSMYDEGDENVQIGPSNDQGEHSGNNNSNNIVVDQDQTGYL